MSSGATLDVEALDFDKGAGLVTVVAVDAASGDVLMVAFADRTAIERTLASGELHLHSRTRGAWHKGETSGNVLRVMALVADCDGDCVLAVVDPAGPACHNGTASCFDDDRARAGVLGRLDARISQRLAERPDDSYVVRLADDRNLRLKKLGEEAAELAVAAADGDRERTVAEAADVLFHVLVAVHAAGATLSDVLGELAARED